MRCRKRQNSTGQQREQLYRLHGLVYSHMHYSHMHYSHMHNKTNINLAFMSSIIAMTDISASGMTACMSSSGRMRNVAVRISSHSITTKLVHGCISYIALSGSRSMILRYASKASSCMPRPRRACTTESIRTLRRTRSPSIWKMNTNREKSLHSIPARVLSYTYKSFFLKTLPMQ